MKDLTQGREIKILLLFTLPLLLGNVCQQLYSTVDSIIVGNFAGEAALTSVGISFPVIFLITALVMGITMGSTILIAQYYGAKNMDAVRLAISTTLKFMLVGGLVVTVLSVTLSPLILRLIRVPEEIFDSATSYLRLFFLGLVFNFGYNGIGAICRGLGDSKTPLVLIVIATFINIFLDLLFVAVFQWGAAGAAVATVIAQAFSFIVGLWFLKSKYQLVEYNCFKWKWDKELFLTSIKIGLPIGIQQMLISIGAMVVTGLVNGFGMVTATTYTVASRIDSFAMMPALNISQATSAFVGQNIAVGRLDRVKKGFHASLIINLSFAFLITGVILLFGDKLMALFGVSQEVIAGGIVYFQIIASFYFVFAVMQSCNGVVQGAGQTVIPLCVSILSLWVVRVPVAAILSSCLQSPVGIWWAIPIGWSLGAAFNVGYYLTGRWKKAALVHAEKAE